MSLVALLLALVALPFAVLDIRIAIGCLILATASAVMALVRRRWIWLGRGALVVILAGSILVGWELWDFRRPPSPAAPSKHQHDGRDREVLLPLRVERASVSRLALLEFTAGADSVYEGLEPQFIDRGHERGIRIIGYRHDGHVDLYDDLSLAPEPEEESRVTGKGRLHYRHVDLRRPVLERDDAGRLHIEFSFVDVEGRRISASIHEHTTRGSVPLNLLAPVGLSSTDPEYFPLFLMHDFEFIRLGGTQLDLTIDERPISLTDFPVPLPIQGQMRSFAKYTVDSEIVAVFPDAPLQRVTTDGDVHRAGDSSYVFDGPHLERIVTGSTEFVFEPALDLTRSIDGRFTMTSHPEMGRISGDYAMTVDRGHSRLVIDLDDVEVPRQRGLLYRFIVSDSSIFGQWPTAYRFEAKIDREAETIIARWINERPGG